MGLSFLVIMAGRKITTQNLQVWINWCVFDACVTLELIEYTNILLCGRKRQHGLSSS